LSAPSISQEWLKLELSNFLHRETISSLAKGMTNYPQKGRSYVTVIHFCMRNIDLEKFHYSMLLSDISNAEASFVSHTLDGRRLCCYALWLKLYLLDLSLYLLQTWLYRL